MGITWSRQVQLFPPKRRYLTRCQVSPVGVRWLHITEREALLPSHSCPPPCNQSILRSRPLPPRHALPQCGVFGEWGSGIPPDESFRRLETGGEPLLIPSLPASGHIVLTLIFGDGWQADAPSRIDSPSPLLAQVIGTLSCVPWT